MKAMLALIMILGAPLSGIAPRAHAADFSDNDLDMDFDPMADDHSNKKAVQTEGESDSTVKSATRQNRSIYIVNQATSGAKNQNESEAKAANTSKSRTSSLNVSDSTESSLIELQADQAKRNRQRAERETEAMANAKIEEARLKDEQRRNQVLFGDRFSDLDRSHDNHESKEKESSKSPTYIQVIQASSGSEGHDSKKGPDRDDQSESYGHEEHGFFDRFHDAKTYAIGLIGMDEFSKAQNIQGTSAFGIGLGTVIRDRFLVEGMFQYSSYDKMFGGTPASIESYSGIGAFKFQFSRSEIRPYIGGLLSYSYRNYSGDGIQMYGGDTNSTALDMGGLGGVELALNKDFAVGLEYRYLWNLTSKTPQFYNIVAPTEQPLDQFSHYVLGVTGRFLF